MFDDTQVCHIPAGRLVVHKTGHDRDLNLESSNIRDAIDIKAARLAYLIEEWDLATARHDSHAAYKLVRQTNSLRGKLSFSGRII